ncbi:MAG: glycerophosphodiester phosphodiesterase family protein [Chitinophagaceae bacterium]
MNVIKLLCLLLLLSNSSSSQNKVLVAAHRGDWRNAPENSLLAFQYAAAMGVDIVELDLKKTKDGEIIIMHDETIDRVCNGKGKPADYTLEEIRKFRLKNGLGRVTNNPIPTLREVMIAVKGKVKVNLDKSYDYYNEAYAILKETGTLKQGIFKSEVPYAALKERYPLLIDSIIYMPVVNLDKPGAKEIITDYLQNMKPYAFELIFQKDTSAVLTDNAFIREKKSAIWINSLWPSLNAGHDDDKAVEEGNTKDSWDWLIAHGATILQTDRPALLLQYLRKKKMHH